MSTHEIEAIFPLSATQQGMFYETVLAPVPGIHIEQFICTITGDLNTTIFKQAWHYITMQHDILRASFVWEGQAEPLHVIHHQVEILCEQQDWRQFSSSEQSTLLQEYLAEDRKRGFQFSQAPLLRLALFQREEEIYEFVWTHHHMLMDGWSSRLVLVEVFTLYQTFFRGLALQLPAKPSYRDYVFWLKQQDVSGAEQFWRAMLKGFVRPTPIGREVETDAQPQQEEHPLAFQLSLSATITEQLQTHLHQHRLTLNTFLQGIWSLLLSFYSGAEDIILGTTVSVRPPMIAGVESLVGLCINTLPMRITVSPKQSLWVWLEDIQVANLALREFDFTPGKFIRQWSGIQDSIPLYESLLVVENYPAAAYDDTLPHDLSISNAYSKGAQTKYALAILVVPGPNLHIWITHRRDRLDEIAVKLILEHFQSLFEWIVGNPDYTVGMLREMLPTDQIPLFKIPLRTSHLYSGAVRKGSSAPIEHALVCILSDILGVENIGIHDNFFELGCDSLMVLHILAQIHSIFYVDLPVNSVFDTPTIEGLATMIIKQSNNESDCRIQAEEWIEQRTNEQMNK